MEVSGTDESWNQDMKPPPVTGLGGGSTTSFDAGTTGVGAATMGVGAGGGGGVAATGGGGGVALVALVAGAGVGVPKRAGAFLGAGSGFFMED